MRESGAAGRPKPQPDYHSAGLRAADEHGGELMGEPRALATFADYAGLHEALRARADSLQISREGLDHLAGLPGGYAGKVLGLAKAKGLGVKSLGLLLAALGCELVLVEIPGATERLAGRFDKRDARKVRDAVCHFSVSKRHLAKIGRKGGQRRQALMSTKASRALGRKGALTRHPDGKAAKLRAARLKAWDTRRANAAVSIIINSDHPAPAALSPLLTGAPR
jgi:hypothetical protein